MATSEWNRISARRDLIVVGAGTLAFALLCAWLELSELVLAWTRPHERFQLDELPGVLLFLALAIVVVRVATHGRGARGAGAASTHGGKVARRAGPESGTRARPTCKSRKRNAAVLARELHDELGQCLNAVKIDAVCLRDGDAGRIAEVRAGADSDHGVTDHLEIVVRDMVRRLRPPGLDELGLPAALENCVEGWRRRLPLVNFELRSAKTSEPSTRRPTSRSIAWCRKGSPISPSMRVPRRVEIMMQQRLRRQRVSRESS